MATKLSLHHPVNNKYLDEKIVEKYKFITIIRNPINRCYSYYQMVKRSRFSSCSIVFTGTDGL